MFLKEFREETIGSVSTQSSSEMFQNEVLRPILKLKWFVYCFFQNYSAKYKGDFYAQTTEKKLPLKMQFKKT
jgi:hypothetical protein